MNKKYYATLYDCDEEMGVEWQFDKFDDLAFFMDLFFKGLDRREISLNVSCAED